MDYDLVTVHPLGGCPMGEDAQKGAVNHLGQVYKESSGTEVYPHLIVCDGAIIPRPLGVNPLLTISGLAERNCELLAKENHWTIDYGDKDYEVKSVPLKPGIQFTESMTGHIQKTNKKEVDYLSAQKHGEENSNSFTFTLTIRSDDLDTFIKHQDHEAGMMGTAECKSLSKHSLSVYNGHFYLFNDHPTQSDAKQMKYSMNLQTVEGDIYFFQGVKHLKNDPGFDPWKDLTTLYIDVFKGSDNTGEKVAKGILRIKVADFKRQLTTIKAVNVSGIKEGLKQIKAFNHFFAKNVLDLYGKNLGF